MHLHRDALLALAETPGPIDDSHVAACAECRAEIDALRGVLATLALDDVPEPSPLFWDHFSRRVHEAIAAEAAPVAPSWWAAWRSWSYAAGACVAMALVLAVAWPARLAPTAVPTPGAGAIVAEQVAGDAPLTSDDEWELVVDVAADADVASAGIDDVLAPASAELALQDLSADERSALATLLREELGGHAGDSGG